MPAARFLELLRHLARHDVEMIVVGMLAAVLQGAPVTTFDLDVLHRRTPENVKRLADALREIGAVYRTDPRKLPTTESHLMGPGHQLLTTRLGVIDCLGAIDGESTYEHLLPDSIELDLGEGLRCRVVKLERLIAIKTRAGRPKDLAALPTLHATLDEIRKGPR